MASYKGLRIAAAFCSIVFALMGEPKSAFAACTSPAGIGGTITWNGTDSVIWCDGTNWYALKNSSGAAGLIGQVQFNDGSGAFAADSSLTWDNTNKRLGIGTATPSAKLEVLAVSNTSVRLKTFTNTAVNRSAVLLGRSRSTTVGTAQHVLSGDFIGTFAGVSDNGGTETGAGMNVVATQDHTDTAHGMALTFTTPPNGSVSAPERMRIDSTGNVGIGTSSPSYLLSLGGEVARAIGMERTSAGTNGYGLTLQAGGSKAATADLNGGNLTLSSGTATGTGSSNMYFQTATAGATGTADRAPSTSMTILGSGNVGIGTTAPESILHLYEAKGSTETLPLRLQNSGAGNSTAVGIGFSPFTSTADAYAAKIVAEQLWNTTIRLRFFTAGPDDGLVQRMILHPWGLAIGPATSNLTGQINLNGARTSTAWNQYGIGLVLAGGPYTDTTSTGTVAKNQVHVVYGSTLAATNVTTYTRAANVVVGPVTAGTNVTITNPLSFVVDSGKSAFWGNVGIGTDAPTYDLSMGGDAVRTVGMERAISGTTGRDIWVRAGGAKAATADLNGGTLVLASGTATGTGSSSIAFATATPQGSTNTTDNVVSTKMTILGNGLVGIGTAQPIYTVTFAKEGTRTIGIERSSPNNSGSTLILQAGGGALGVADKGGGSVEIVSGIATGVGSSFINFKTATAQSSTSTTDNTPDTKMTILGSGSVGIGTTSPAVTSLLDLTSTTRGLLPPRMTTAQRTAITTPATGLIVYDTDLSALYIKTAAAWAAVGGSDTAAGSTGQVQFNNGSNALAADAGLTWDNTNKRLGIGTGVPGYKLNVVSTDTATTSGSPIGMQTQLTVTPAADSSADYTGAIDRVTVTGAQNITGSIRAGSGIATHSGSGTLDTAYGLIGIADNNSSGTISKARGAYNYARAYSAGTVTSGIGTFSAAMTSHASANMTSGYGAYNVAQTTLGTMTTAYGSFDLVQALAPTTISVGQATRANFTVASGATITTAYGLYTDLSNAGTVGSWYGLYIPAVSGTAPTTARSPIYVADTGTNYFAGSLLIGRTATSAASTPAALTIQHTYGTNYGLVLVSDNAASSSVARFDNPNGNVGSIVISGTTTTYTTTSDRRLKENIADTQDALAKVMRIPVRDFSFKSDPTQTKQTGFIAQELEKVMPEAVATNGDDGEAPLANGKQAWSVDYGRVTPLLLKAVQELKAANDNLRQTVEAQGREIEALKALRP